MFSLDQFLTTTPWEVNATRIRFQDCRTGEIYERTIFRPGQSVNFARLGPELQHYGYNLLWIDDTPGMFPGRLNWSEIFGQFFEEEGTPHEQQPSA